MFLVRTHFAKKLAIIAILFFSGFFCRAWDVVLGKPYEGWPKIVAEISLPKTTYRNFGIELSEAKDQTGSGSGGHIVDIKVTDSVTGKTLLIETQSVAARVLAEYHGYPQIESWGRGGGGTYSRILYRVEKGEYCSIRDDLFDVRIENAKRKDVTALLPGGSDTLYYTGTMYPTPGTGE